MACIIDHAVLRYLERVRGIDVEAVRTEMKSPAIDKAIAFGCDTVIMGNGARLIIKDDTVVTVLPKRLGKHPRAH